MQKNIPIVILEELNCSCLIFSDKDFCLNFLLQGFLSEWPSLYFLSNAQLLNTGSPYPTARCLSVEASTTSSECRSLKTYGVHPFHTQRAKQLAAASIATTNEPHRSCQETSCIDPNDRVWYVALF
jgi:hypothetical protein